MPVCLNHTDREAATRCTTCFKPLCYDCVIRRGRDAYCSRDCLDKHLRTSGNISRLAARERAIQRRKLMIKLAVVLIVAGLVVVGCLLLLRFPGLLP